MYLGSNSTVKCQLNPMKSGIKKCFVITRGNDSEKCPSNFFVNVPVDKKVRLQWQPAVTSQEIDDEQSGMKTGEKDQQWSETESEKEGRITMPRSLQL